MRFHQKSLQCIFKHSRFLGTNPKQMISPIRSLILLEKIVLDEIKFETFPMIHNDIGH